MREIIIVGRGGQGAQVAGNQLAQAFFAEGKYVQSFATYGGARRGGPVASSIRVDEEPVILRCNIERADAILCFDASLLDAKLLELTSADVATRVARRLIDLVDLGTTHGPDGHVLETALSQEELAALCGASREAVARVLRDLREEGVLSTDRRRVTVLDLDALRARV